MKLLLLLLSTLLTSCAATTYKVPMHDGVVLNTIIDEPPFFPGDKQMPAILERSPYGADAEELIALVFAVSKTK